MEEQTYDLKQIKRFLKGCKGHKFECFYKIIFAYKLSRLEVLNLKWEDIDFDNNKITFYPVKYIKDGTSHKYNWGLEKIEGFARTYPLLPTIKQLLLKEQEKQLKNSIQFSNYNIENADYVCLKPNGDRLNANTLSRNIKYIARDNKLPEILLSGIKNSAKEFFIEKSPNYDFYLCWTRFDIFERNEDVYQDYNLSKKSFTNALDNLLNRQNQAEM